MSAGRVSIARPRVTTGPEAMSVDEATVMYLREAANRVRHQRYWGSGVSRLVSDLLDDTANAMEADQ